MDRFIRLARLSATMAAEERPAFGMNHVTVVPENFQLEPVGEERRRDAE